MDPREEAANDVIENYGAACAWTSIEDYKLSNELDMIDRDLVHYDLTPPDKSKRKQWIRKLTSAMDKLITRAAKDMAENYIFDDDWVAAMDASLVKKYRKQIVNDIYEMLDWCVLLTDGNFTEIKNMLKRLKRDWDKMDPPAALDLDHRTYWDWHDDWGPKARDLVNKALDNYVNMAKPS